MRALSLCRDGRERGAEFRGAEFGIPHEGEVLIHRNITDNWDVLHLRDSRGISAHMAICGILRLVMAQMVHAGCPAGPSRMARTGYTACDVAERVLADRHRRPAGACMVEDAPQMRGVSAWPARGLRTARAVPSACRARPAGLAPAAEAGEVAGGSVKDVKYGKRGGGSGAKRGNRVYHVTRARTAYRTCS